MTETYLLYCISEEKTLQNPSKLPRTDNPIISFRSSLSSRGSEDAPLSVNEKMAVRKKTKERGTTL